MRACSVELRAKIFACSNLEEGNQSCYLPCVCATARGTCAACEYKNIYSSKIINNLEAELETAITRYVLSLHHARALQMHISHDEYAIRFYLESGRLNSPNADCKQTTKNEFYASYQTNTSKSTRQVIRNRGLSTCQQLFIVQNAQINKIMNCK